MIELRVTLTAYLKTIHPNVTIDGKSYSRVHYEKASDKTPYPYIVFNFPNTFGDGEFMETIVVDIDGWDNSADTTALETLMAAVNTGLNKKVLTAENMAVVFYLDRKLSLTDEDKRIRRRKYVYQAKMFG